MAIARQNKRLEDIVEGVDLDEIDIAVAAAQQQANASGGESQGNSGGSKKPKKPASDKAHRTIIVIGIVLASLIMAISILLPSLSAVIEAFMNSSATTEEAATTEASTESSAETEESEDSTEDSMQSYIDTVDERYGSTADTLKAKVEADATDKASLINLANTYYEWASSVSNFASSDEQAAHVSELYQNAITYYDQYLALDNANSAQVNRILCQYYMGDTEAALSALEDFCAQTANYAPAWSNLGMMYNAAGDTESALSAYNKALDADPNDTYGLKSSVQSQIETLTASEEATTEE